MAYRMENGEQGYDDRVLKVECPECRERLTAETLKDPPRFLKNTLSELKIKCDYNERGCPGYVQLGNLQSHVERCDFAPVACGHEGCEMMVNKKDKVAHERELCLFRMNSQVWKAIKASQDEIKLKILKMYRNVTDCQTEIKVHIKEVEIKQDDMK
ncbi:E3 ubiquitin- ligase PDZRN3 isoform X1, partial [Paramuricea clavata]